MENQQIVIYRGGEVTTGEMPGVVPPSLVHFSAHDEVRKALSDYADSQVVSGKAKTFTMQGDDVVLIDGHPHYASFDAAMGPFFDVLRRAHQNGTVSFRAAVSWPGVPGSVSMTLDMDLK